MAVSSELVCGACGAPVESGHEYCLECGGRLVRPRRPPGAAAWAIPSLALLVVAAGSAAAAIGATHGGGSRPRAIVALSPLRPLPAAGPPTRAAEPGQKPAIRNGGKHGATAAQIIAWPARNGFTIVLSSLPVSRGIAPATARARQALKAGLPQVGVLVSSSYASLHPGYYVVFSGIYNSIEEARGNLVRVRARFPGASSSQVAR